MPKVSIIIPVYNCEAYLDRCVRSVLAQTETSVQLILVDDGSTDGSGALCDNFAEQDGRVLVIHQKNAGVSAARNAGLDAAAGEYIGFVDADDYIAQDTYETALSAIGDSDMAMWDAQTVWDNGHTEADTIPPLEHSRVLTKADWTPGLLSLMAGAVWRCLYRAELLKGIRFPVGIKLSEDRLFNIWAMGKAQKLCYLKQALYFRYMRPGSAVNRYHGDKFEKNLLAMEVAGDAIEKYWDARYRSVYIRMFVIGGALAAVNDICAKEFPGKSRLKAIRELCAHNDLTQAWRLCPPAGLREKLLHRKSAFGLLVLGKLFHIKNGQ